MNDESRSSVVYIQCPVCLCNRFVEMDSNLVFFYSCIVYYTSWCKAYMRLQFWKSDLNTTMETIEHTKSPPNSAR